MPNTALQCLAMLHWISFENIAPRLAMPCPAKPGPGLGSLAGLTLAGPVSHKKFAERPFRVRPKIPQPNLRSCRIHYVTERSFV